MRCRVKQRENVQRTGNRERLSHRDRDSQNSQRDSKRQRNNLKNCLGNSQQRYREKDRLIYSLDIERQRLRHGDEKEIQRQYSQTSRERHNLHECRTHSQKDSLDIQRQRPRHGDEYTQNQKEVQRQWCRRRHNLHEYNTHQFSKDKDSQKTG